MNPLARALLGVALGSCLTLLIHPASRPFMTGLLPRPAEASEIRDISSPRVDTMRPPISTAEAGLWMQLGCERLTTGRPLSKPELQSLVGIARYMPRWSNPSQFNNAFWPQMEAVFLDRLGDTAGAQNAWKKAAKCEVWKDYQAARLLDEADHIRESSGPMSWHLAGLYYQRRFSAGSAILDYARRLMGANGDVSKEGIELRYDTLVNAHLMANGAQSIEILKSAIAIANLATHDLATQVPGQPLITERALREKARGKFYKDLNDLGFTDQASRAKDLYDEADSRPVLTTTFAPSTNAARIASESIVASTLPDSLLILALVGAIVWPAGLLLLRFANDHTTFTWPPTLIFGGVLGVSVVWLTLLPLAGLVALLCCLFLAFTPKNERSRLPSDLGHPFSWIVGLLSILFIAAVTGFFISLSTPAKLLLPSIFPSDPTSVGAQIPLVMIGLAVIFFALLLLVAPMWAFGRRVRTPYVLGLAFKTFGTVLVAVGLGGTVLLGPLCVYADYQARHTLKELVGNEPEHYYNIFK
jgi:hypothetical protein